MAKYKIAWLPGDGIGVEVLEAAKIVLDRRRSSTPSTFTATSAGSSGARKATRSRPRTIDLLKNVDAAMFGAITSKPVKAAEAELVPELQGQGPHLPLADRPHAAAVRPLHLPAPVQGLPGQPAQLQGRPRPRRVPREHRGPLRRRRVQPGARGAVRDAEQAVEAVRGLLVARAGRVRHLLQDQHAQGVGADHPRGVRLRDEVQPQEGHRRAQGQRRARDRRPLPRDRQAGREGLPGHRDGRREHRRDDDVAAEEPVQLRRAGGAEPVRRHHLGPVRADGRRPRLRLLGQHRRQARGVRADARLRAEVRRHVQGATRSRRSSPPR